MRLRLHYGRQALTLTSQNEPRKQAQDLTLDHGLDRPIALSRLAITAPSWVTPREARDGLATAQLNSGRGAWRCGCSLHGGECKMGVRLSDLSIVAQTKEQCAAACNWDGLSAVCGGVTVLRDSVPTSHTSPRLPRLSLVPSLSSHSSAGRTWRARGTEGL